VVVLRNLDRASRGKNIARSKTLIAVAIATALSACTQLPIDGPNHRSIDRGAATSMLSERDEVIVNYALIDINEAVLHAQADAGPGSFYRTFGDNKESPPSVLVGPGDVLQISVFESRSGGLFIPADAGVRPGNYVTFPIQTVDRSGSISVPFAGRIRAANRTLTDIQLDIEQKLEKRAIEPQVIVAFTEQNATAVSVVGDVINAANRFNIRQGGDRILDMISRAGGIRYPGYETFVTLQRMGHRVTVYFPTLVNNPDENVYARPGDTIYVYREQQKFVALGAVATAGQTFGLTGQFAFEQEKLSLNEALAKAGGLIDSRANASQVFLYRPEFRSVLQSIGADLRNFPPGQDIIPTVYRANFRDPSAFFFTQGFQLRNRDIIYVANADSVEVTKFLNYIRTITSTVSGVASDTVITGDAVTGRHILGN
jgi:polysaccharide export outer membrane protein